MMHQTLSHLDAVLICIIFFGMVLKSGGDAIEKACDKKWGSAIFNGLAGYGFGCVLFDIVGAW